MVRPEFHFLLKSAYPLCQVKEAVKQNLSLNPIYQNAIFKIWFVYICLGRPLKFHSSTCQGWFSLDDRMAGVLFVYLFYLGDFSLTARRFFGIIINIISVSSYKGDIYVSN